MYIYHAFINALSAYRAPLLSAVPLDQIRSPGWWYQINVCVCVCVREREREREICLIILYYKPENITGAQKFEQKCSAGYHTLSVRACVSIQ